jgi:hypothetical protein
MRHIDSDLLRGVLDGQLAPRALLRVLCEHLKDLCPQCGANLELLVEGDEELLRAVTREGSTAGGQRYAAAFHRAGCLVAERAEDLDDERARARRELDDLLALPAAQRASRVASAHRRFRSRALVDLLLEETRSRMRSDPVEGIALAELVPVILYWTPGAAGTSWAEATYARSLALRANALRIGGELPQADAVFRELHRFVADHPLEGEELHAELASLEASLRLNQDRLEEAEELLDRAIALSGAAGDAASVAKNLIKRGDVQRLNDRLDASGDSLRAALRVLGPDDDTHLVLCAVGALGLYLCAVGEAGEAEDLLARHAPLLRGHDDVWMDLRMKVLRGRIAHGLGRSDEAERLLLAARQGYLDRELGYDAALVTLDLALLYLDQGRTAELKDAARLMQPIFEVRNVHRQALAALMLFEQAAAAEKVTEQTIHGLRRYLERTRIERQPPALPS